MERDPVRQKLKDLLWKRGVTMNAASLALGRNRAYMHQYLERGLPKVLNYPDSVTLGELLDCDPAELRHETVPKRKPAKKKRRSPPAGVPGVPLSAVPEMTTASISGRLVSPATVSRSVSSSASGNSAASFSRRYWWCDSSLSRACVTLVFSQLAVVAARLTFEPSCVICRI